MGKDIIAVTWGGLGDVLVCTPALRAIKETHPDRKIIVYCAKEGHRKVLLHNHNIDSLRLLLPKSMWRYPHHLYAYLFNRKSFSYYYMFFHHIPPVTYEHTHAKEVLPEIFADLHINVKGRKCELYFTRKEEEKAQAALASYRNVIFMHIHSRCSINHHWPEERWNELVASLPQYTFIQIGQKDEPQVKGAVDWRGKTDLREAFCLIKYADSFVGVDSCFAHATNAFDVPGVILFGDSAPVFFGHDNNINIYKNISCSPCQEYLNGHHCPIGHACMNLITVEEVRAAVVRQFNSRNK